MASVLCDTELHYLLPSPNTRIVGGDYSVHFIFSLMLFKCEGGVYAFKQVMSERNLSFPLSPFPPGAAVQVNRHFLLCCYVSHSGILGMASVVDCLLCLFSVLKETYRSCSLPM